MKAVRLVRKQVVKKRPNGSKADMKLKAITYILSIDRLFFMICLAEVDLFITKVSQSNYVLVD